MTTVLLRPWNGKDKPELARIADNRRIANQLRDAFPHPYMEENGQSWIAFANSQDPVTHFAVECDGVLVGSVGYIPGRDIECVSAEVGYWIGESYWGRGLATLALIELIRHIQDRGGFTRLFALPFSQNGASRRVLEKAGYQLDAVLRRSATKNGQVVDQAMYSLQLHGESQG